MLAHAGRNYCLIFDVCSEVGELFDNGLGFDKTFWCLSLVGEGQALLPIIDLAKPFGPGRYFFNKRKKKSQVRGHLAFDSFCGLDDLVDILGHDLEVTYSADTFGCCSLCLRGKSGGLNQLLFEYPVVQALAYATSVGLVLKRKTGLT